MVRKKTKKAVEHVAQFTEEAAAAPRWSASQEAEIERNLPQQSDLPLGEQLRALWQGRNFNAVVRVQGAVCAVLFCALLLCRAFAPVQFAALQEGYFTLFESADYTPSFVRFAQKVAEVFSVDVLAQSAPEGASLVAFTAQETTALPVETYYISSAYGWREDPFSGEWTFHYGVDCAAAEGEAVYAVMAGVVESNVYSTSYGNCIRVRHTDGTVSLYAHLQYAFAREGEVVAAGQQIGTVGQTGWATGAHLHLEIIVDGTNLDPTQLVTVPVPIPVEIEDELA